MNQTCFFCRDSNFILLVTGILLQIAMVSPGMHFVKNNYESQSRTMYKMSQLRKQRIQLCLGLYVTRQLI